MHLGSLNRATSHYDLIRELSAEEIERHSTLTPYITEARDRLALFKMLDRNYSEWKAYLKRQVSLNMNIVFVPNDVFAELGIRVVQKA